MLYYYLKEVTLPNGARDTLNIVTGAKSDMGDDAVYDVEQLSKNTETLNKFASNGTLRIAAIDESNILYVTVTNPNASLCTDITSVINVIKQNIAKLGGDDLPVNARMNLVKLLITKFSIQEADANCIVYFALEFIKYEKSGALEGPVEVGPGYFDSRYLTQTQTFVNEINNSLVWPFTKIEPNDNVTNFQSSCKDNFFIMLPRRNAMLEEDVKVSSFIPKLSELCDPYNPYNIEDITEYKTNPAFPDSMYPMVEGSSTNNTAAYYENEQLFAASLIEWVQFNMKNTLHENVDVSPENPNIDKLSQDWLEELVKLLYTKHWYHNINIPIYRALETDEDESGLADLLEDTATKSDSVISDYEFRLTPAEKDAVKSGVKDFVVNSHTRTNAIEVLISFLREASLTVGYNAYIQAIIQLGRWGERKPTCIVIDNYALVFSLGNNKVKPYIGNISDYKVKQVDGCSASAVAALYNTVPLRCKTFMRELNYAYDTITAPVGITAVKVLENVKNPAKAEMNTVINYSIIDVVNSYVTGDGAIQLANIKYNDGVFEADSVVLDQNNTYFALKNSIKEEDNLETPFKSSKEFEDLIMDLDIRTKKLLTHFDILEACSNFEVLDRIIQTNQFSSKEDLDNKVRNATIRSKANAFIYVYGGKLLPIYAKVSLKLNELSAMKTITFSDVLNVYKEVLTTMSLNIFGDNNNTSTDVQKMDMFGESQVAASTPVNVQVTQAVVTPVASPAVSPVQLSNQTDTTEVSRFSFVKQVPADASLYEVVDGDNNKVGYLALFPITLTVKGVQRQFNGYIAMKPENVDAQMSTKVSGTMAISSVLYRIMYDLYLYQVNEENNIVLYFDSVDSMKYYTRLLKSVKF